MRAKDGNAVDLASKEVRGGACAGYVGCASHRETTVGSLGAPQAKVGDRMALCRANHARGLGGHEGLEVHEVEQGGLDELAVDEGALHAHHGLARKDHVALGHGMNREVEVVVAQVLEEGGLEHGAAARCGNAGEILDVLVVEDEVLDEVWNLAHAAGDGIAAAKGVLAEERVERCLRVHEARLPEALGHGELVEVGVERDVRWLGAVRERHCCYFLPLDGAGSAARPSRAGLHAAVCYPSAMARSHTAATITTAAMTIFWPFGMRRSSSSGSMSWRPFSRA